MNTPNMPLANLFYPTQTTSRRPTSRTLLLLLGVVQFGCVQVLLLFGLPALFAPSRPQPEPPAVVRTSHTPAATQPSKGTL